MFNPTSKQQIAIENMETFCGIQSHRTEFSSREEFDSYFKDLQKKGTKKADTLDKIKKGETSYQKIREDKRKKTREYYGTFSTLRSYAVDYINRYNPTLKQTEMKLFEKSGNINLVVRVIDSVKGLINEKSMAWSLVRTMKMRGKNISHISVKLYHKRFDSKVINEILTELKKGDTILEEYSLEDKIKYYKKKGKSRVYVYKRFVERKEDKEVVVKLLDKIYGVNGDNEALALEIKKMKEKRLASRTIIRRLLTKGFQYNSIITALDNN